MVRIETNSGDIVISCDVLTSIAGHAANESFGVADMAPKNAAEGLVSFFMKNSHDKGVSVTALGGDLISIDLHIVVTYGLNISAITQSIINKVKYTVEEMTGLKVSSVNIFVDAVQV